METIRIALLGCSDEVRLSVDRAGFLITDDPGACDVAVAGIAAARDEIDRIAARVPLIAIGDRADLAPDAEVVLSPADIRRLPQVIRRELRLRAAEDAEARYRAIVEQAHDVIFTTDREGHLTSLNGAFETMTGWRPNEWMGRHFTEWIDEVSIELAVEHFRSVQRGETSCGEYDVRTRTGEIVTVETKMQPLIEGEGAIGTLSVARDVTVRHERHLAAEKEKRLATLGHLAAAVAHEFNNVLMSILPFAELLKRRSPDDERTAVATRHIFEAIRRGKQVSQEILRFARTNAIMLAAINVREWIAHLEREATALFGPRFIVATNVGLGDDVFIRGDRALVDQIATNLLLNARDAMPEGGFITIEARRAEKERGCIEVAFRDSGFGISPDVVDRVFDPLFTTKPDAVGLGLSIALRGMAQQDGTIRVTSQVGVGTTFTLVFPEAAAPARMTSLPKAGARQPRRILLVEDDEAVGEGISALLSDEGFDVRLVIHGREAAAAMRQFEPDVTILDVNLGDVSGLEVFESLQRERPDLRVVFSTGHADAAALEDVRRRGVPTIMKPYEIADLVAIIDQLTGDQSAT